MKRALQIILCLSVFGSGFSGVLSYKELFGETEAVCPAPGAAGTIFGYPACVYGFFMFLAVVAVSAWGLFAGRHASQAQSAGHEWKRVA